MGDVREVCEGRGDGTDCPNGEVFEPGETGPRCEECRHHWELDETEPERRAGEEAAGLTRPMGDPWEAGRGTAAWPFVVLLESTVGTKPHHRPHHECLVRRPGAR
ncbi:hypothetical protein ACIA8I_30560 [Streptomyces rishiriensis]|uniref:hypothetical protein n=2 Tax=Streptomyces rishiriensis TaxID=68264 RepID=UPI0037A3C88F